MMRARRGQSPAVEALAGQEQLFEPLPAASFDEICPPASPELPDPDPANDLPGQTAIDDLPLPRPRPAPLADVTNGAQLLDALNPQQRDAVAHPGGPLLILAGAGSGKTRVLTQRIAWLLSTDRAKPHEILAITFTNKAAEEMRERAAALTGRSGRGLWVMTFHAACARILRRDGQALGYTPSFTIYDTSDSRRIIKRLLGATAGEGGEHAHGDERGVQAAISAAKNQMLSVEQWVSQEPHPESARMTATVWERYDAELRRANALDFDDLLIATYRLLCEHPDVGERYRQRFAHVLVDEYQDTNQAQYQLLKQLLGAHHNLTVVGDSDQAIYSFRYADIRNILNFETDFPNATVIKLQQNYRSTQTILGAANAVIANNTQRRAKTLWTDKTDGSPVHIHELATSDDEAALAVQILHGHLDAGGALADIAILYRTNSQSQPFEEALAADRIPYQMAGALRFYERSEVKDAIAYLRLISNPVDDEAFARIINIPRRNLGNAALNTIRILAAENGSGLLAAARPATATLGAARSRRVDAFVDLIDDLRAYAQEHPGTSALLDRVFKRTGLVPAETGEERADSRRENLLQLLSVAASYDAKHPDGGSLDNFLETLSLTGDTEAPTQQGRVTLMTLHASKGLEYPVVILAGLEERLFPHEHALRAGPDAIEEERRLCYVGITRAQTQLHLTHVRKRVLYGRVTTAEPSRFLSEIPESLCERQTEAPQDAATPLQSAPPNAAASPDLPSPNPQPQSMPTEGESEYTPAVRDRVKHPSFGAGTVTVVDGPAVTVVFDRDPAEPYELHARLARLQPAR